MFFDSIMPDMYIWCLGGGAGALLPTLLSKNSPNGRVVFTEASVEMLKVAKRKVEERNRSRVIFHHNETFNWPISRKADLIICQYFLDVLTEKQLEAFFSRLEDVTHPSTQMLFVDFYPHPSHRLLMNTMIHAFRWLTGHPRKDLPDYDHYFEKFGWCTLQEKKFKNGFIKAKCLGKFG
jgi:ubiquinone/menaquinone biosynthesis C-methylase UbiE